MYGELCGFSLLLRCAVQLVDDTDVSGYVVCTQGLIFPKHQYLCTTLHVFTSQKESDICNVLFEALDAASHYRRRLTVVMRTP